MLNAYKSGTQKPVQASSIKYFPLSFLIIIFYHIMFLTVKKKAYEKNINTYIWFHIYIWNCFTKMETLLIPF